MENLHVLFLLPSEYFLHFKKYSPPSFSALSEMNKDLMLQFYIKTYITVEPSGCLTQVFKVTLSIDRLSRQAATRTVHRYLVLLGKFLFLLDFLSF